MDTILKRDQIQAIINNAPKNVSTDQIINGLVSRGYKLEGLNDQPQEAAPTEAKKSFGEKVADTGASIIGLKHVAEGLGNAMAQKENAKMLEDAQNNATDIQTQLLARIKEKKAKGEDTSKLEAALTDVGGNIDTIGKETETVLNPDGITKKQVAGDMIQIGSYLFPFGKAASAAGKVLGRTGGAIASGATGGYLADIGFNLQDNKEGGKIFKPGVGTVLGIAAPAVGGAVKAIRGAKPATDTVENTLGRIIQGKTDDIPLAQKALANIDTTGIKTRSDLSQKLSEGIKRNSEIVDQELAKDTGVYSLKDLAIKRADNAGNEIATDYVGEALKNLDEMYGAIGDDVAKSNINLLAEKAATEGLTRKEVNDISRMYGQEFGGKAFGKTGDPLTSVNAQKFENVRTGLKETARAGLGGEEAKAADAITSAMYNTQRLIDRGVEGVNALQQRIKEKNIVQKLTYGATKMLNTILGGAPKAALSALQDSNVGNKTFNWLGLEKELARDLKIIQKAQGATTDAGFAKILNDAAKGFKFPGDLAVDKVSKGLSDLSKIPNQQGGFIDLGGIVKRLDNSDRDVLKEFVDTVALGKKPDPELAQKVQNFADSESLESAFKGNKPLAKEITSILDADRVKLKKKFK